MWLQAKMAGPYASCLPGSTHDQFSPTYTLNRFYTRLACVASPADENATVSKQPLQCTWLVGVPTRRAIELSRRQ